MRNFMIWNVILPTPLWGLIEQATLNVVRL